MIGLNKALKISIIAGVLLISFSVAYHFLIFVPKQEQLALERYNQEKTDGCLAEINKEWDKTIERVVESAGLVEPDVLQTALDFAIDGRSKAAKNCAKRFGGVVR